MMIMKMEEDDFADKFFGFPSRNATQFSGVLNKFPYLNYSAYFSIHKLNKSKK